MFNRFNLASSQLYNEKAFYVAFVRDIRKAHERVIIESPFITLRRFDTLYPLIRSSIRRGVRIVINTRHPESHDGAMRQQALSSIATLQSIGVEVLYTSNLHRKLAMIDNEVLWEGSLNILSQSDSCEMMRRTRSKDVVRQMIRFTKLSRWYN